MSQQDNRFRLTGKVGVVIGGGGVLGGAMADGLALAGADVVVVGRTPASLQTIVRRIEANGGRGVAVVADTSVRQSLTEAMEQISKALGSIDILVNAQGINSATPFFDIDDQEWQRIIDVNLKGTFLACQVFAREMVRQGCGGSIINISSASSEIPLSKVFTYSITKAGINNMTRFLANELAPHRIRVNAIAPGFFPATQNRKILTEERVADIFRHTPMKRFGEPNELIGCLLWLASESASSFVTGTIVRVDGGFTAKTI